MIEQGSKEWLLQRMGKFNASETQVFMGKSPKLTQGAMTQIYKIVSERMGSFQPQKSSEAMRWGVKYEPEARDAYIDKTGYCVEEVSSIQHEKYPFICGSPDGVIIEERGGIEIKCPHSPENHIKYAHSVDYIKSKHYTQIQQNIWINQSDWWDFVSYDPRSEKLPIFIHRFHRDQEYIDLLEERVLLAESVANQMYEEILNPNCNSEF